MTAAEEALLHRLEARIHQLALEHKALKERCEELSREVEDKDENIRDLQARTQKLQTEYADLKLAKMIDIGSDDMKDARSRFSRLVREVDKCIALLNV